MLYQLWLDSETCMRSPAGWGAISRTWKGCLWVGDHSLPEAPEVELRQLAGDEGEPANLLYNI